MPVPFTGAVGVGVGEAELDGVEVGVGEAEGADDGVGVGVEDAVSLVWIISE